MSTLTRTGVPQVKCRLVANEGYSNSEGQFVLRQNYITLIMFSMKATEFYRIVRVHDRVCVIGHLRSRQGELDGRKFRTTFLVGDE